MQGLVFKRCRAIFIGKTVLLFRRSYIDKPVTSESFHQDILRSVKFNVKYPGRLMKSTLISNAERRPESRISQAIVKEIWKFFSLIEFYKLKFNKTSMITYLVGQGLLRAFSNMKRQYTVIYLTPKTRLCLFATILTWQTEAPVYQWLLYIMGLEVTTLYWENGWNVFWKSDIW